MLVRVFWWQIGLTQAMGSQGESWSGSEQGLLCSLLIASPALQPCLKESVHHRRTHTTQLFSLGKGVRLSTASGKHNTKGRCQTVVLPQVKTTSTQENELAMVTHILSAYGVSAGADEPPGAADRPSSGVADN